MHVRGRPLEPIGVLSGGRGGYANSWKQTRSGPPSSRNGKIDFSCYIDRHVASVTRAANQHAARFHSALPSYGCRPTTERRWLGA